MANCAAKTTTGMIQQGMLTEEKHSAKLTYLVLTGLAQLLFCQMQQKPQARFFHHKHLSIYIYGEWNHCVLKKEVKTN